MTFEIFWQFRKREDKEGKRTEKEMENQRILSEQRI